MRSPDQKTDRSVMAIPLAIILILCVLLMTFPQQSRMMIESLRLWITNTFGWYYVVLGLAFFGIALYVALSRRGDIRLGESDKPSYGNFAWGAMVFTATMAADILFFALHEWVFYYEALPLDYGVLSQGERHLWASTYPLFHWGAIPWSFFILPAAAYGYMFFVKGRSRQRLSEACRPVIGRRADGHLGNTIDMFSVFGLLAGTATTFSLATPLITLALHDVLGLPQSKGMTIAILLIIAVIYTIAVVFSFKGIAYLAKLCIVSYIALLVLFLMGSDLIYTVETTITALGNMTNNFLRMSTWLDPLRLTAGEGTMAFPQSWTVFYWAYWVAWCVATPFFIGRISKGRTIRQVILGGFTAGLLGTFTSFSGFGHYGLHLEAAGRLQVAEKLVQGASQSEIILDIFRTLPTPGLALVLLVLTMILFYASTFDALAMVMATYSYKNLGAEEEPGRGMKAFWSMLFVLLPIALLFSEQALAQLQTVAIIAALPISAVLIVVIIGFLKESKIDQGTLRTTQRAQEEDHR
jgi:BCCT family betaine/carnitine transporter